MKTTLCEGMLSFAQPTVFGLKKVSNLQLNSFQPRLHPVNISLWRSPLCATLWNCTLLSAPHQRESFSVFYPGCSRKEEAVCVPSRTQTHTHTLSHPVSLCWCWGSPACCVSVPSGQTSYADVLRSTVMKIGSCFDQSTCCDIPALPSPPEPIWNLRQQPITPPIQMNPFFPVRLDERGSLY